MPFEVSFILLLPLDIIVGLIDELDLEGLIIFLMVNPLKMSIEGRKEILGYKLNNHLKQNVFEDVSEGCVHADLGEPCDVCCGIKYNLIDKKPPNKELHRMVKKYHDFYLGLFGGIFQMTNNECQHQMIQMFFKPNLSIDYSIEKLYAQMSETKLTFLIHNLVLCEQFLYYATPNILPYIRILLEREFVENVLVRDSSEKIVVMGEYLPPHFDIPAYRFMRKSSIYDMTPEKYYHICYHLAKYLRACDSLNMLKEMIDLSQRNKHKILLQTPRGSAYGMSLIQIDPNSYSRQIEYIINEPPDTIG